MSMLRSRLYRSLPTGAVAQRERPAALDLRAIRAAARGKHRVLPQHYALEVLAMSGFPNRHRDLEAVLTDESAAPRLRYLAALGLAHADREAAERILISASETRDARVRAGVLRSLGRIGGPASLDVIERMLPGTEGATRRHGLFAAALIAHRLGLPGHSIAAVPAGQRLELVGDAGERIRVSAPIRAESESCLVSLGQRPYNIELAEQPMYQVRCGRCTGMVLLNRDYAGPDALSLLVRRKALVAIGALRHPSFGTYSPAIVFLTNPDAGGGRVQMSVHLTNGQQVFAGEMIARDDAASWMLHAVRRLGAFPIRIEGDYRSGRFGVTTAASGRRVVLQTRPRPMTRGRSSA